MSQGTHLTAFCDLLRTESYTVITVAVQANWGGQPSARGHLYNLGMPYTRAATRTATFLASAKANNCCHRANATMYALRRSNGLQMP